MKVVFRPRAEEDLDSLYAHIAKASGDVQIAFNFAWRLREVCLSLSDFPERGAPRFDIRPGLRILPFERSSVIAYHVTDAVEVIAIFHGGQDWTTILQEP